MLQLWTDTEVAEGHTVLEIGTGYSAGLPEKFRAASHSPERITAATLTPDEGGWQVRKGRPVRLWERIERVLDAYDAAGLRGRRRSPCNVHDGGQHLRHPQMPGLPLPRP